MTFSLSHPVHKSVYELHILKTLSLVLFSYQFLNNKLTSETKMMVIKNYFVLGTTKPVGST